MLFLLSSKRCLSLIPSSSYLFFSLLSNVVAFKKWKIFHYWKAIMFWPIIIQMRKHVLVNEVQHTYFNINSVSFSYTIWKKNIIWKKPFFSNYVSFSLNCWCIFFTELVIIVYFLNSHFLLSFSHLSRFLILTFPFWRKFEKHISWKDHGKRQ